MLTPQSIFDATVFHLAKQGRPARTTDHSHNICMLRAPDGTKCAMGIHITDEEYTSDMEKHSVHHMIEEELMPERFIPFADLLDDLQQAHDTNIPINDVEPQPFDFGLLFNELMIIAKTHGLNDDIVREALSAKMAANIARQRLQVIVNGLEE